MTGWASRVATRDFVAGIWVTPLPEDVLGTRVTLRVFPRVAPRGLLQGPQPYRQARPAKGPNGQRLEIVGRLVQVDVGSNLLRVQIYPTMGEVPPFSLHLRGTERVLRRIDPTWSAVRLGGSLISDLLVIDEATEVYAPIPPRWAHWNAKPGKRNRAAPASPADARGQVLQRDPHE